MDLSVRERLRAARDRRDVQALKNAYELIKSARQGKSVLNSSDNFNTDLYVLCAEQAFQEEFEKFVLFFMKAIDFATHDQSLSQIVNALNQTEDPDKEWRAELMINLLECFLDASKLKEAKEFSSTAASFIKENVPDKYAQMFSLMVYHKLMDVSQVEKEIENSIHLAVIYKMQMLKLQWDTNEFPSDATMDLNSVYVLLKQYDVPPGSVLSMKIPLILELARFSVKVNCIKLAYDCILDLKRAGIIEQGKLIEIECLECEYEIKKIGTKIGTYTKGVVEHLRKPLMSVADVLEEIDSMLILLRCQVHMEIARIEEDEERIEAAVEHLQKAIHLNNSGQYQEHLRLTFNRLRLHTILYKSPERLEDQAVMMTEQAKRGKRKDNLRKKRSLLVNAGHALAPDSFQTALDSENEAKGKSGNKISDLCAKAQHHIKCMEKVDEHLKHSRNENDRESDRAANKERCHAGAFLTNKVVLMGNVKLKGNLGCTDHQMVEFKILKAVRRARSKLSALDFRRADFGLFRDLLSRVPWDNTLEGREVHESWLILKDHLLQTQERYIPTKTKSGKNARRPAWMNKELLDKLIQKKEAYKVEARTGSLRGIQRNCPSSQGSAQKKKASTAMMDDEGDSLSGESLLPAKSFSFERDLLRILAEIRFINAEATINLLRLQGVELNDHAVPPEDRSQYPGYVSYLPENDPEWKTYSLWIDYLSQYAMENFQRAAEIGEELNEAWIVHNAVVYVLNYNRHLISSGRQREIIEYLQTLLGAIKTVGHNGSTTILLMLCNALARGLILCWIPKPKLAEKKKSYAATDRSKKAAVKKHEKTNVIQSFSVDPSGLPDIKAALEICEFALNATTGTVHNEAVPIAAQQQVIATWVKAKQLNQQQIGHELGTEEENNDGAQNPMARVLVGLEMYSCNGLGLMDFTVPSLSQLVKLALECSWSDSLVELQTLTRLTYFAYVSHDYEIVTTCSERILQTDENFHNRDTKKYEMPGSRVRQEMLSTTACIQGKSIMENLSGRKHLRVAASKAFVQSARYAGEERYIAFASVDYKGFSKYWAVSGMFSPRHVLPSFDLKQENEWQKVDYLMEFAEWLYCNQFCLSDVIKPLDWVVDLLLRMKFSMQSSQEEEKNTIPKFSPTENLKIDIGANGIMPQINLEDCNNIKQLEAFFRAQTLMALISGHSSPFHQQHCLMAYACIVRIWQVSLSASEPITKILSKSSQLTVPQKVQSITGPKKEKDKKKEKQVEFSVVKEKPKGKGSVHSLPASVEEWAHYDCPKEIRDTFRQKANSYGINWHNFPNPLAEVIANEVVECRSLSDLYHLRIALICSDLKLNQASLYHEKAAGEAYISELEQAMCRQEIALKKEKNLRTEKEERKIFFENAQLNAKKAEVLIQLGLYQPARLLLSEAHAATQELRALNDVSRCLYLFSVLANLERNHGQARALLEKAQFLGGNEWFWYNSTLSLVDAILEEEGEGKQSLACEILEHTVNVLRSTLLKRPNRQLDLGFIITSLEARNCSAEMLLERANIHRMIAKQERNEKEKRSHYLDAYNLAQKAVSKTEEVFHNVCSLFAVNEKKLKKVGEVSPCKIVEAFVRGTIEDDATEQEEAKSDIAKSLLSSAECSEQEVTDGSLPINKCQYDKHRMKIQELQFDPVSTSQFLALHQAWRNLCIPVEHFNIMDELSSDFYIIILQHSEDRSNLYSSLIERPKASTAQQKGKPTQPMVVQAKVSRFPVNPDTFCVLLEKVRVYKKQKMKSHLRETVIPNLQECLSKTDVTPTDQKDDNGHDLTSDFAEILEIMEEYLKPVLSQFDFSGIREQRTSVSAAESGKTKVKDKDTKHTTPQGTPMDLGLCVVLLGDTLFMELPLEALNIFKEEGVSSVSRDFSLQILYNRAKSGALSPSQKIKEILEKYRDQFTLKWEGVIGNIRVPSQAEWEQLLTNCSAFLFYGMERFMSHILLNRLVAMNIPRCHLMILLDLVRSKESYQRITNSDSHKSCLRIAIERPTETAVLLSLTGVRSVIANQWYTSLQENAERLEILSEMEVDFHSSPGDKAEEQTVHTSSSLPATHPSFFNCVLYGLPNIMMM
ncbi:tetratricopeptide repeat protein hypothetical protein [Limosa lapponica baueri]|uniref:Cilia-and flagella-associated protein 46 n=1 Tax=Limosa lapponica baueri TaxID=1758121 RepID=A0A2I0UB35_LIMLA|nr:tetratricopeptide repeat protein hypothetical protein [Limosa lapponica baueri]